MVDALNRSQFGYSGGHLRTVCDPGKVRKIFGVTELGRVFLSATVPSQERARATQSADVSWTPGQGRRVRFGRRYSRADRRVPEGSVPGGALPA